MSYSDIASTNITSAHACIAKYLTSLLIKTISNNTIRRWQNANSIVIYTHNTDLILRNTRMKAKNIDVSMSSNNVKLTINNYKNGDTSESAIQLKISPLFFSNSLISLVNKINNYANKYDINFTLLSNINCVFFLLMHIDSVIYKEDINMILKNLIDYDNTKYIYRYYISKIYNCVDFYAKKNVVFKLLTNEASVTNIFKGIVFALNKYLDVITMDNYVNYILIPSINALCYILSRQDSLYKKFLNKFVVSISHKVIKLIFLYRQQLEEKSNSSLSEIVIDEILDKADYVNSVNQYAHQDSYIIDHDCILDVWDSISELLDINTVIHPMSIVVCMILSKKIHRIKNIFHDIFVSYKTIKQIKSSQTKKDIYESMYWQYIGYFHIVYLTKIDVLEFCRQAIKEHNILFKDIFKEFYYVFDRFSCENHINEYMIRSFLASLYMRSDPLINKNGIEDYDKFKILSLSSIQIESINTMIDKSKFVLSLEQGMGKTRTIIAEILYLYDKHNYSNFIILMPATYIDIWQVEINKAANLLKNKMPNIKLISLEKYRIKNFSSLLEICFDLNKINKSNLDKLENTYLCIDESIVIKNSSSKNYQCCKNLINFLECINLLSSKFKYKIRMTTGSIQSENLKDWHYIGSFLFNLKEGSINLEYILNSVVCPGDNKEAFMYEANKLKAMQNNLLIKKRASNDNLSINKTCTLVNFWEKNPLTKVLSYFTSVKNNLYTYLSNISKIIGTKIIEFREEEQERTLLNLRRAVSKNYISGLIKDIYVNTKNKVEHTYINEESMDKYKNVKTEFLWNLKVFAEYIMPFKMFNFYYNLDAGIISHKFILQVLVNYCIYDVIYSSTKEQHVLPIEEAIKFGYDSIKGESGDKNNDETDDENTVDKIIAILHKRISIEQKSLECSKIMNQSINEIQCILLEINYVSLFVINFVFKKYKINIPSLDNIKKYILNQIKDKDIGVIKDYYKIIHDDKSYDHMLDDIAKHLPEINPNGLVYYDYKMEVVSKAIDSEISNNRTIIIFFELKSHINLFIEYLSEHRSKLIVKNLEANDKNRGKILQEMHDRKINVLCTTYALTARGFSFSNTDTIIFFMPTAKYDLYNQAKYRNNRLDNKLSKIYQIDFKYDDNSINNKIYQIYTKKEVAKNIMENLVCMPLKDLEELYDSLDPDINKIDQRFEDIYAKISTKIHTNEINKEEFIAGLKEIAANIKPSSK